MSSVPGDHRFPPDHLTIRVPPHHGGWTGDAQFQHLDKASCLVLPRAGERRRDDLEPHSAGWRPGIVTSRMAAPNNGMQRTALRAAAEARRYAGVR